MRSAPTLLGVLLTVIPAFAGDASRDSDGETNQLLLLTQSPDEPSAFLDTSLDDLRLRSGNKK